MRHLIIVICEHLRNLKQNMMLYGFIQTMEEKSNAQEHTFQYFPRLCKFTRHHILECSVTVILRQIYLYFPNQLFYAKNVSTMPPYPSLTVRFITPFLTQKKDYDVSWINLTAEGTSFLQPEENHPNFSVKPMQTCLILQCSII